MIDITDCKQLEFRTPCTIGEFVEALQQMPQDAEVWVISRKGICPFKLKPSIFNENIFYVCYGNVEEVESENNFIPYVIDIEELNSFYSFEFPFVKLPCNKTSNVENIVKYLLKKNLSDKIAEPPDFGKLKRIFGTNSLYTVLTDSTVEVNEKELWNIDLWRSLYLKIQYIPLKSPKGSRRCVFICFNSSL